MPRYTGHNSQMFGQQVVGVMNELLAKQKTKVK